MAPAALLVDTAITLAEWLVMLVTAIVDTLAAAAHSLI